MKWPLDSSYRVGLAYEKLTLEVLRRHAFHLKHTGCSGDGGQDFVGHWLLPKRTVPIVGQCKCWRRPVGPKDVREFEGVLCKECSPQNGGLHVGVMVSRSWYSAAALKTFLSSPMAMIFMQIVDCNPYQWHTRLEPNMSHPSTAKLEPNTMQTDSHRTSSDWCTDTTTDDAATVKDVVSHTQIGFRNLKSLPGRRKADAGSANHEMDDTHSDGGNAEEVGYISDIAVNRMAKKELGGDVQVLWRWRTVRGCAQRRLELTT